MATVRSSPPRDVREPDGWAGALEATSSRNGKRRISCIMAASNAVDALRRVVPELSAALSASGHDWELVVVDVASIDHSSTVLRSWCRLPGYRLIELDEPVPHQRAIRLGLEDARGDAVLLLEARVDQPLHLVRDMIQRWDAGHRLVYATRESAVGQGALHSIGVADGRARYDLHAGAGTDRAATLVLVDRELVRALLR